MDIRLYRSTCLCVFRLCCLTVTVIAIAGSALPAEIKILLCLLTGVLSARLLSDKDPVCGMHLYREFQPADSGQKSTQKIILQLRSQRRIEFTLTTFYCLWWLQILYLSAGRRRAIVLVLPDSCSADERRRLRQLLYHRQSTATGG